MKNSRNKNLHPSLHLSIIIVNGHHPSLYSSGGFRVGKGGAVEPPFGRSSALFSRAAGRTILTVIGLDATLSWGL